MSSRVYDALKWMALVLLPTLASLYFGLGQIWDLPKVEEIVGSITVIDTALGVLISKSGKANVVGDLIVKQDPEGMPIGMRIEATKDPLILKDDNAVVFKVKREQDVI